MKKFLIATLLALTTATSAMAVGTHKTTWNEQFKKNVTVDGNLAVTGTSTFTGAQTLTGATTLSGNTTVGGTLGVTGAVTLTTPLTAANIQTGSAKRQVERISLSPNTGAAADGTVYRGTLGFGRAGTVTKISYGAQLPPTVGTDTIKVLKNGASGNTMLSTATVDANGITANTQTAATLTSTGADLALTATDTVYAEYSAGTQTQDAIGVEVTIEFEPTDF